MTNEERIERAKALFMEGYNCSQSVAMAFADRYGVDEALMARMAASFGGGIGRMRETCGAACGMFMLAGLETTSGESSADMKKANYEVVQRLASEFREECGSLLCKELLGLNKQRADGTLPKISITATPEPRTADYYRKRPCVQMVETAARIYARYIGE